jgi:two-component system response regulator YesN
MRVLDKKWGRFVAKGDERMYKILVTDEEICDKYDISAEILSDHGMELIWPEGEYSPQKLTEAGLDILMVTLERFQKDKTIYDDLRGVQVLVVPDTRDPIEQKWKMNQQLLPDSEGRETILDILDDIVHNLKAKRAKENFEKMVIQEADRVKPIIKEQFLRDYILGFGDTGEIFNIYCEAFNVACNQDIRMVLFSPDEDLNFEDSFFLRNIIEGYIGNDNILLSTTIKDHLLLVTTVVDDIRIVGMLKKLEKVFEKYYNYRVTMVYSGVREISQTPKLYDELTKCLEYCFYAKDDSIISADEITMNATAIQMEPDYGGIEHAVKGGNADKAQFLIRNFFQDLERAKSGPAVAKTYCLELYVCIIRCCEVDKIDKYMKGIMSLQEYKTLKEIQDYIMEIAMEIVEANSPKQTKVYSSLINDTLRIIEENLGNEQLSLRWIASNILYTNVDYLGKLFKKEIGENFSHYVMQKRMEMAKDLIVNGKKDRIYEVAEKVGYGSNSQYFSQVFKKYTGTSPLEYKEYARMSISC